MTINFFRAVRIALLSVGVAMLLAACSGSSSDDTAADDTETSTTEEATTTTSETTTTDAETTSTTAASAELDTSDPRVVAYCSASATSDALIEVSDPSDPDALRVLTDYQIEALTTLDAPDEIADDIDTVLGAIAQYPAILEAVDYDFVAAEAEIVAIAESPEFLAATGRLDAFEVEYCPEIDDDIGTSPPTTNNPLGLTADDIREFLATADGRAGVAAGVASTSNLNQEEALCFVESTSVETLVELFALGTGESATPTPEVLAGMTAGLDACGLSITALTG